jgi:hypothetical protein
LQMLRKHCILYRTRMGGYKMFMDFEQGYRLTRQAWIDGVTTFHPNPKESYTLPWEQMPSWEQDAVKALYQHVRNIILPSLKAHDMRNEIALGSG